MNAQPKMTMEGSDGAVTPVLRTLLIADLADSTAWIEQLGDSRAAILLQRLDLQIRDLIEFTGGRLIDKADGLLALFERPVQAVDFGLRYQRALLDMGQKEGLALKARIGIHVGEVMTWENSPSAVAAGAKPLEVEGLAKPVAARLMSLALPGQILLSGMAQNLAQRAQLELGERAGKLRWLVHGRYRFKGVPAPMLVHEVGEPGLSPLRAPPSGAKAWREVPFWRRPPVLAAEALVLVGLIGGSLYTVFKSPPAIAFHERDWVVVGDLSNFTGDPRLEESLDSALRISLEQSRFVNIVPEMKVEDSLQRMGRSEQATVDRAVGSEIALREGARALLLPSVAEVGGRLRVNVEVVDPNTQVTVYAQSAEGQGVESALGSLDKVTRDLRERLGESLGEIQANGKPLAQVTTANIDALRAFGLAQAAFASDRYDEAVRLYEEAIKLDPEFAMAYAGLARVKLSFGDDVAYYQLLGKAESLAQRLTRREALMISARAGMHDPPPASLANWRLLVNLYPDEYYGYYSYALASWYNGYRYDEALKQLAPATSLKNPKRASAFYLQGVLQLGLEDYDAALASFRQYEALGKRGYSPHFAQAYAAQRQFRQASAALASQTATGSPYTDFSKDFDSAVFLLDQGKVREADAAVRAMAERAPKITADLGRTHAAISLLLRVRTEGGASLADVRRFLQEQARWIDQGTPVTRRHDRFLYLLAGFMATQAGDLDAGRRVYGAVGRAEQNSGYPELASLANTLAAAIAIREGRPDEAVARLSATQDGSELYLSHWVLMDAYAAANRADDALAQAKWLAGHRGRAYAEFNSDLSLHLDNVLGSNLAMLSAAEFAQATGRTDEARGQLSAFLAAWPDARKMNFLRARIERLEKATKPVTRRSN